MLDVERLSLRPEDRPAPCWPVLHFVVDDEEIVATLYWEGDPPEGGHAEGPTGWCMHVQGPSAFMEVWGDLPVAEALERAIEIVLARAEPCGCTEEESRQQLMWQQIDP